MIQDSARVTQHCPIGVNSTPALTIMNDFFYIEVLSPALQMSSVCICLLYLKAPSGHAPALQHRRALFFPQKHSQMFFHLSQLGFVSNCGPQAVLSRELSSVDRSVPGEDLTGELQ